MTEKPSSAIAGEVVEHTATVTVHELCISCNVSAEWIAGLVEHGAIEPVGRTPEDWRFTTPSLLRVAKAKRLERDLGLNLPGVALALDLLDELDAMRARLRSLESARRRR